MLVFFNPSFVLHNTFFGGFLAEYCSNVHVLQWWGKCLAAVVGVVIGEVKVAIN